MIEPRVIIVMLRQPRRSDPNEMRTDPMWEFGSFGCTGCHGRNLMHLRRLQERNGVRLAFAQNGPKGVKLVLVTPPVKMINHGVRGEAKWDPADQMPLTYDSAPTLVDNFGIAGRGPMLELVNNTRRSSAVGKFTSRFRTCAKPLPAPIGNEIIDLFAQARLEHFRVRLNQRIPKSLDV